MTAYPILFVDHAIALGGAEHSLLMLLRRIDRARFVPYLACPVGKLAERAGASGISVHLIPMPRLRRSLGVLRDVLNGGWRLARLSRQLRARGIVANTVRAALYAASAAQIARRPFIWYMRDLWLGEAKPRYLWLDGLVKKLLCVLSAGVIANSHITAGHIPCHRKVRVVHNGVEIDRFTRDSERNSLRREYGFADDDLVVGTVGRLRPWKGQDRFLRVLACVRESIPEVRGLVVGGALFSAQDGYVENLECLTDELGLRKCVVFAGQLDDPRHAIAAMDVFVHPGDPEPFGLVNVEAMASAKPVVAFAHGALPEIVISGQTGILVPPGNNAAMAESIVDLLRNPQKRAVMGHAARRRAVEHFAIERVVDQVSEFLQDSIV